jgi:hypothetical protein
MNCDEAFDALTNPAERESSSLKWHLEFCPRCREMQEVLAPALAMFAVESDSAEPFADEGSPRLPDLFSDAESNPSQAGRPRLRLPAPFLTPDAVRLAEETARSLHPARSVFRSAWFRCIAAGAACLLLSLGLLLATGSSQPASPAHSEPIMLADRCLWTEKNSDKNSVPPADPSSRWVVLSCVACHLEQSLE